MWKCIYLWYLCLIPFHRGRPGHTIPMLHWWYPSADLWCSLINLCSTGIIRVWSPQWRPWLRCFFFLKEWKQDSEAGSPVRAKAGIEQSAELFFCTLVPLGTKVCSKYFKIIRHQFFLTFCLSTSVIWIILFALLMIYMNQSEKEIKPLKS